MGVVWWGGGWVGGGGGGGGGEADNVDFMISCLVVFSRLIPAGCQPGYVLILGNFNSFFS